MTLEDNYLRVQDVCVSLSPSTLLAVSYTRLLYLGVYTPFPLPTVSNPGRLHTVSITRTFHTPIKGFTRHFHYTRIQSSRNTGGCMINVLSYADDSLLLASSWRAQQKLLNVLESAATNIETKTKIMSELNKN